MKGIILLTLLLNCATGISQSEFPNGQKTERSTSYNENWEFFELDEPIKVRILFHLPSSGLCGNLAFASVSIVQTKDDKIFRILDLCNTENIPENKIVEIIPSKKPEFYVQLPSRTFINPKTGKVEAFELDKKTLKTTHGNIETK